MTTAIIGGTGLADLAGLEIIREHVVATPYGTTSAPVQEGRLAGSGQATLCLHRH